MNGSEMRHFTGIFEVKGGMRFTFPPYVPIKVTLSESINQKHSSDSYTLEHTPLMSQRKRIKQKPLKRVTRFG